MKEICRYFLCVLFAIVLVLTAMVDSWAGSYIAAQEKASCDSNTENKEVDSATVSNANLFPLDDGRHSRYPHGCGDRPPEYRKGHTHGYKEVYTRGYRDGYREGHRAYRVGYEYVYRISLRPSYHVPYGRFRGYPR